MEGYLLPPDSVALNSIRATNKNTVTSIVAGTVETGDKITLYRITTRISESTLVGSDMTFTADLSADDAPKYTRTNPNGHESALSTADGKILALITAAVVVSLIILLLKMI